MQRKLLAISLLGLFALPTFVFSQDGEDTEKDEDTKYHTYFYAKRLPLVAVDEERLIAIEEAEQKDPEFEGDPNRERVFIAADELSVDGLFGENGLFTTRPFVAADFIKNQIDASAKGDESREPHLKRNERFDEGDPRLHSIRLLLIAPRGEKFDAEIDRSKIRSMFDPKERKFKVRIEIYYQLNDVAVASTGEQKREIQQKQTSRSFLYFVLPGTEFAEGMEEIAQNRVCTMNMDEITFELYTNEIPVEGGGVVKNAKKLHDSPKRTITLPLDVIRQHLTGEDVEPHAICSRGW